MMRHQFKKGDGMNIEYIKSRVMDIDKSKDDDELAHALEDRLRNEYITYIAESGIEEISEMAKEVLKTKDIDFARWCA